MIVDQRLKSIEVQRMQILTIGSFLSQYVKLKEAHRLCWWLTGPLPMPGSKPYCDKCADAANCREEKKKILAGIFFFFLSAFSNREHINKPHELFT